MHSISMEYFIIFTVSFHTPTTQIGSDAAFDLNISDLCAMTPFSSELLNNDNDTILRRFSLFSARRQTYAAQRINE